MMNQIITLISSNSFIRILLIAVTLDTLLGVLRAIKEHKFNSCVGIDGAIRKAAMLFSVCLLMATDVIMHINILFMVPETYIKIRHRKVRYLRIFLSAFHPVRGGQHPQKYDLMWLTGSGKRKEMDSEIPRRYDRRTSGRCRQKH